MPNKKVLLGGSETFVVEIIGLLPSFNNATNPSSDSYRVNFKMRRSIGNSGKVSSLKCLYCRGYKG